MSIARASRLKGRTAINELFESGSRNKAFPLRSVQTIEAESAAGLKVGVSIPKRLFNRAVDRNLYKRRVLECWRMESGPLELLLQEREQCMRVMIIAMSNEMPDMTALRDKIIILLNRLESSVSQSTENI